MNIGIQIKALRAEKRATQEELAACLGVSAQAVSKWETGASAPDIALLPGLSAFFGVSIDELFALPEEQQFERIENMFYHERRIAPETFDASVRFLQAQAAKSPDDPRAWEDLAELYNHRAAADHAEASDYAKKVIALDPDRKGGWVAYQEANNALCGDEWYDNHFTVIEFCREVLEQHPDNFPALYAIIENLLGDRRWDDAVPYIRRIGEVAPESDQMLTYLGDVAQGKGDLAAARAYWDRAVAEHPDRWQAYCSRADRLKKLGLINEAAADYERCYVMQKPPRITDGLYSLAQLHEAQGDFAAAIRDRERIIAALAEDWATTDGESVDENRREIERLRAKMG